MTPYEVHWETSPSAGRILESLSCRGSGLPEDLAARTHCSKPNTYKLLRQMHAAGVIRIVAYRHNIAGLPTPIYALGPGQDLPRPRKQTPAERCAHRRLSLELDYGREIKNKVLNRKRKGCGYVYIDGKRITPGSVPSPRAGSITR
jgi:hypothetical protein